MTFSARFKMFISLVTWPVDMCDELSPLYIP